MGTSIIERTHRSVVIPDNRANAVLRVDMEGTRDLPVAVIRFAGGAAPSAQYLQDMDGNIYYTVFGHKMTGFKFICDDPNDLCNPGEVTSLLAVLDRLREAIEEREIPVVTMAYKGNVFTGYLNEVAFESDRERPFFTLNIIGRML